MYTAQYTLIFPLATVFPSATQFFNFYRSRAEPFSMILSRSLRLHFRTKLFPFPLYWVIGLIRSSRITILRIFVIFCYFSLFFANLGIPFI